MSGIKTSGVIAASLLIAFSLPMGGAYEPATQDGPSTANEGARQLINADAVHEDLGITGEGMTAAMWGFGNAGDHRDLESNNKLVKKDNEQVSDHPTHVAGTLTGQGIIDSAQRGVAPDSTLLSYGLETSSTDSLVSETDEAQDSGAVVSHNSWAWTSTDSHGNYDSFSEAYDRIARGTASGMDSGMSVVFPAGNYRNDVSNDYDTIPGAGTTAKNSITVGAVNSQKDMTSFSGWGPTDSGRMKPDVVADGAYVKSTMPGDSYAYKRGTSVSTPAVSGGVVLINKAYQDSKGELPSPATVKAVMLHTAEDISTEGPDYRTGWGVPDLKKAVRHVQKDESVNMIQTGKLSSTGETTTFNADFSNRGEGKITLVWADKAGSNGDLINDLDLNVKTSDGQEIETWKLDSSNPEEAATKGEDHTNPVEQVEVPDSAGNVEITVEADSLQDSQRFSLVSDAAIGEGQPDDGTNNDSNQDGSNNDTVEDEPVDDGTDESDNSVKDSPELKINSPTRKTYREKIIQFGVNAEHVSDVRVKLGGETHDLKQVSSNGYAKLVEIQKGFQTAEFTAVGENGDKVEKSVYFYGDVSSDSGDDDTSSNPDDGDSDSDSDSGSDDSTSDSDSDSDNDTVDDGTSDSDGDSGSDDSSGDDTDGSDGDTGDDSTSDSDSDSDSDSSTGDEDNTDSVSDDTPPSIEIVAPVPGNSYDGKTEFRVKFDEEVESAKVTLNRRNTYTLEKDGDSYTGEYELEDGLNTMMFMGTDTSGNFNSETLTVRN